MKNLTTNLLLLFRMRSLTTNLILLIRMRNLTTNLILLIRMRNLTANLILLIRMRNLTTNLILLIRMKNLTNESDSPNRMKNLITNLILLIRMKNLTKNLFLLIKVGSKESTIKSIIYKNPKGESSLSKNDDSSLVFSSKHGCHPKLSLYHNILSPVYFSRWKLAGFRFRKFYLCN